MALNYIFYMFYTAPSFPPPNVTAFSTSSQSVVVRWLPLSEEYWNGLLRGYRVAYYRLDATENATHLNVTANNTEADITGLEKFTNYSVQVLAYTILDGNYSQNVYIQTAEDGTKFLIYPLCYLEICYCLEFSER